MITKNQFPFGKPAPIANRNNGFSGLTIIILLSSIMIGGAFYYLHITNTQNENKKN